MFSGGTIAAAILSFSLSLCRETRSRSRRTFRSRYTKAVRLAPGRGNEGRDYSPGELTCRFPALMICRVHRPSAFSPQKCTLRKGQSSKLELRTSRGRSNSKVEVVPIGEVSSNLRLPRGKNRRETCFTTYGSSLTSLRENQASQ